MIGEIGSFLLFVAVTTSSFPATRGSPLKADPNATEFNEVYGDDYCKFTNDSFDPYTTLTINVREV